MADAETYWLATARPDGGPHLVPVLAVWVDGTLHFAASPASRKGRNLVRDARCAIATRSRGLDLVVEGAAARVTQPAELRRVAGAYAAKYGWAVTVRDGAFRGDGAPTAGPPPYNVYEVVPTVAFGFPADGTSVPTRWRFERRRQHVDPRRKSAKRYTPPKGQTR
jgi:hypothetical protein